MSCAPSPLPCPPDATGDTLAPATTSVRAPATCGEFVQGATEGGDFLVNCPIDLFSEATVASTDGPGLGIDRSFAKVRQAIEHVSDTWGIRPAHRVEIASAIPRGKGMASSSADMTAGLAAFLRATGLRLSPAIFGSVLTSVEPSDCVHYPGIAHVDHLNGTLRERLPVPHGLRAFVVDCGGEVDTMGFDRDRARSVHGAQAPRARQTLEQLRHGLATGDARRIGRAATASARLNQEILYKPQLDDVLGLAGEVGAVGVNCGHSGSVLGILYRDTDRLRDVLRSRLEAAFGRDLAWIGDFAIIGGGCRSHSS